MAVGYATPLRNAKLDALTTFAGASPKLRLYSGTRPATGGAITTLLVENICNATFAPAASAGVLTANPIASGTAVATGTATWARLFKNDGTTIVADMSVGTSAAEVIIANTSIVTSAVIAVSSLVVTAGNP